MRGRGTSLPGVLLLSVTGRGGSSRTRPCSRGWACSAGAPIPACWRACGPESSLLGVSLPGMDDYEVCRRMRGLRQDRSRIVVLTVWRHEDDRRKVLEAGFDTHLTKPADPGELAALIASVSRGCSP